MKTIFFLLAASCVGFAATPPTDVSIAAAAVNALGVDLYRLHADGDDNLVFSPYSIQDALAMTYNGADGSTRTEMQHALHFPAEDKPLNESFAGFAKSLAELEIKPDSTHPGRGTLELASANRLFGQRGYGFIPGFIRLLRDFYSAPLEEMDFRTAPDRSREAINHWVAGKTETRIRDLIPPGFVNPNTDLVLVNALYLRASWATPFESTRTRSNPFLVRGREKADVPMMVSSAATGYARHDGFQIVARRFCHPDLQFIILLPDKPEALASLEKQLSSKLLEECAHLPAQEVVLHLPKFRLEPPTIPLAADLETLGMPSAFGGGADFNRMGPPGLFISEVLHKAFLALDEKGVEAAAATAVVMEKSAMMIGPKPVEVNADHPFLFAIQHVPSGACLFLGRLTDPR